MTRDEAVTVINQGLSFRRSSTARDSQAVEALKEAQRGLEMGKTLPWFLISEDATLSGSADDPDIAWPTGFLREVEGEGLRYFDSDGNFVRRLEKGTMQQLQSAWKGSTLTTPYAYALRSTGYTFFPTPDAAYTVKGSFYIADTELTSNIENSWLQYAPDLMIARAGLLLAADLANDVAVTKFAQKEKDARDALFKEIVAREMSDQVYMMGGNH